MDIPLQINQKCIVRDQDCKRVFQGSWICFVACPNSDEIALELDILQQKLREFKIEPYIAVDRRNYQKDIFCEKICTKIIESQFCIAFLNDVRTGESRVRIPNANVYYEYGLMTSFRKKIIPIQLEGHRLAFNIQSLDTLKYKQRTFSKQIEDAIREIMLKIKEESGEVRSQIETYDVDLCLDLLGLVRLDQHTIDHYESVLSIGSLGFRPYEHATDSQLCLVGIFDDAISIDEILFKTKFMTLRVKNYCDQLENRIAMLEKEKISDQHTANIDKGISEIKRGISYFRSTSLLIIHNNSIDIEDFENKYSQSVKDLGYNLTIDILDKEKRLVLLNDM